MSISYYASYYVRGVNVTVQQGTVHRFLGIPAPINFTVDAFDFTTWLITVTPLDGNYDAVPQALVTCVKIIVNNITNAIRVVGPAPNGDSTGILQTTTDANVTLWTDPIFLGSAAGFLYAAGQNLLIVPSVATSSTTPIYRVSYFKLC